MSHNLPEPQFSHLYNGSDDGASKCGSVPCRKMIQNVSLPWLLDLCSGLFLQESEGRRETLVTFSQPIALTTLSTL